MTRFGGDGEVSGENTVKRNWVPGGDNSKFIDESRSEGTGRVGGHPLVNNVNALIVAEMKAAAKKMGENPGFFEQIFETYNAQFWKDADKEYFSLVEPVGYGGQQYLARWQTDADAFEELLGYARFWYSNKLPGLADHWSGTSSGSGSGRGRGSSGPSASDIRKQFDVGQLATRVDDLHRAYLLDKTKDPRGIAKAYVNAIVKNPDQKLDFDTFVLNNYIQKSPRYASIYANKPAGISETDYLGNYFAQASAVLRPEQADDAAVGAAQFGTDAQAFEERLKRSNEYRTSAPFMESLQGRMSSLKNVMKG